MSTYLLGQSVPTHRPKVDISHSSYTRNWTGRCWELAKGSKWPLGWGQGSGGRNSQGHCPRHAGLHSVVLVPLRFINKSCNYAMHVFWVCLAGLATTAQGHFQGPVRKAGLLFGDQTEVCSQISRLYLIPWATMIFWKSSSELSLQLKVLVRICPSPLRVWVFETRASFFSGVL